MKLLVVGGGGREHAIIKKLKENPTVETIFALPGNGGMAEDCTPVAIAATDIDAIVAFALEQKIDYAVFIVRVSKPFQLFLTDCERRCGHKHSFSVCILHGRLYGRLHSYKGYCVFFAQIGNCRACSSITRNNYNFCAVFNEK